MKLFDFLNLNLLPKDITVNIVWDDRNTEEWSLLRCFLVNDEKEVIKLERYVARYDHRYDGYKELQTFDLFSNQGICDYFEAELHDMKWHDAIQNSDHGEMMLCIACEDYFEVENIPFEPYLNMDIVKITTDKCFYKGYFQTTFFGKGIETAEGEITIHLSNHKED